MFTASYEWVLAQKRPLTERLQLYSQEEPWLKELRGWQEQVEGFNHLGDRWFVTIAKRPGECEVGEALLDSLVWHILPRPELRGMLPGILSARTAAELLELAWEESVVLAWRLNEPSEPEPLF